MIRFFLFLVLLLFAVATIGCGGKSYNYADSNEEKPGPGLFSGDDGVFTLIKRDRKEAAEKEQTEAKKTE